MWLTVGSVCMCDIVSHKDAAIEIQKKFLAVSQPSSPDSGSVKSECECVNESFQLRTTHFPYTYST